MSREIKFRAFHFPTNKMVDVSKIEFQQDPLILECEGAAPIRGKIGITFSDMMQFTGLKDKNGKEIYEGDILKVTNDDPETDSETVFRVIEWNNDDSNFSSGRILISSNSPYFEIISNIYKNPELLK